MSSAGRQSKKHHDKEWLQRKYWDEELSQQEIADRCDVVSSTIHRWMQKLDVPTRSRSEANRTYHPTIGHIGEYEIAASNVGDTKKSVYLHKLAAVAWFGFESVADNVIHHKNGIPWDNRESNFEVMSVVEHAKHHAQERAERQKSQLATTNELRELVGIESRPQPKLSKEEMQIIIDYIREVDG